MTQRPVKNSPQRQRAPFNRRHLTESNVHALRPRRGKQYLVWDEGTGSARGLAVLVSPTGTKSYRCVYYYPGSWKPHYRHLGRVGVLTLEEARKLTRDTQRMAKEGEDPKASEPHRSGTFAEAVKNYIAHEQIGAHGNRSALDTQAVILKSCEAWKQRPVATIRFQEVQQLLWLVRDGHAEHGLKPRPYLANRLYSHLRDLFNWCARTKSITVSPMHDMQRPWSGAKRRERNWFAKSAGDEAIKSLWRTADQLGGDEGRYVKLMLLTGKRKTALASMNWEEIDDTWFWDPPASQAKNKRLHGVPLPALAQRVLHPRQKRGKVFERVSLTTLQAKLRAMSGIEDFFWHGLRHLAETKTAELRGSQDRPLILPHVRDLLFDHASKRGSGGTYDHHDYVADMRAAMSAWSDYVERLVQAEGVAVLR